MINFHLSNIHADPKNSKLKNKWELLVNIEGDLYLALHSKLLFNYQLTIVELAVELKKWISEPEMTHFKFDSMNDDISGLFDILAILAIAPDSYRIQSIEEEKKNNYLYTRAEVVHFVNSYIELVKNEINSKFFINLAKIGL